MPRLDGFGQSAGLVEQGLQHGRLRVLVGGDEANGRASILASDRDLRQPVALGEERAQGPQTPVLKALFHQARALAEAV